MTIPFLEYFTAFRASLNDAQHILNYGGFKLGIGGVATFKNAGLDKILSKIPIKNIVLETDSTIFNTSPFQRQKK